MKCTYQFSVCCYIISGNIRWLHVTKKNNPADPKLLLVLMLSCKSLLSHILMGKKIRVNFERIFANISQKLWTNPNISPFREALLCILHHEPLEIWSMSTFFNSSKSELQNLGGKIRGFWLVALIVQFSHPPPYAMANPYISPRVSILL